MKVGRTTIDVNGSIVKVPNPPANMQGTTYVPLRFIVEQLGAIVKWIPNEQSIIYTTTATNVQLWLNKKQAKVDGKVMAISAPLKKINETVMVPIGILSEQLGGTVKFKVETGEIVLTAAIASASHHDHSDTGGSIPEPSGTGANIGQSVVEITKSAFIPKKLTIKKGQTVKWVNKDTQIHTVFDLGDAFASKNLLRNDNFVYTFKDTGTYTYYCSTHPTMEGEITVTD
jgi:plastocyanin